MAKFNKPFPGSRNMFNINSDEIKKILNTVNLSEEGKEKLELILKEMQECILCGEFKLKHEFAKASIYKDGIKTYCKDCYSKIYIQKRTELKNDVIKHYGDKCSCCSESNFEFLTIDHINGGGRKERKTVHNHFYEYLKKNNYPKDGYRLLCMNCNFALGVFKYCPHQKTELKLVKGD